LRKDTQTWQLSSLRQFEYTLHQQLLPHQHRTWIKLQTQHQGARSLRTTHCHQNTWNINQKKNFCFVLSFQGGGRERERGRERGRGRGIEREGERERRESKRVREKESERERAKESERESERERGERERRERARERERGERERERRERARERDSLLRRHKIHCELNRVVRGVKEVGVLLPEDKYILPHSIGVRNQAQGGLAIVPSLVNNGEKYNYSNIKINILFYTDRL
jgi:hypothetical protein